MLFNSYAFLFLFLPLLLLAWRLAASAAPGSLGLVLLLFSMVFYALWGLPFLLLLLAILGMNYAFAQALAAPPNVPHATGATLAPTAADATAAQNTADTVAASGQGLRLPLLRRHIGRKQLLALALALNLLPLLWFKYSAFLVHSVTALFYTHIDFSSPGLPLGISFYTFIQIAWLVSVYKGQVAPQGFARHTLFSACFPYVISGPIVRYEQIGPQLDKLAASTPENLAQGFSLLTLGLAKKVLLADSLALYADAIFNGAEKGFPLSGAEAWLGSLSYTFQLYFDFSGYTDMALGLALMLGLRLPKNFDSPYKSTGIVDFWRRWHITLGAWLRDFLYIPLGGNRRGKLIQYRNLFLTMFIGGAWHGAGWTFLIWGALHGLMLGVNHFFRASIKGKPLERLIATPPLRLGSILFTFFCINLCWVVFRATSVSGAWHIYTAMFSGPFTPEGTGIGLAATEGLTGLAAIMAWWLPNHYFQGWIPLALLLISFALVWALPNSNEIFYGRRDGTRPRLSWSPSRGWATGLAALAFACLILVSRKATFLYFQF